MQVFVDMDGVLANFDAHYESVFGIRANKVADNVDWQKVRAVGDFYAGIPPMPDMRELWGFVSRLTPAPIVLTGIPPAVEEAASNKRAWIARHLGEQVEVRCCRSRDKRLHCTPGDVLIDDWDKYRALWLAKGGRWITHTSARETISCLISMGVGTSTGEVR